MCARDFSTGVLFTFVTSNNTDITPLVAEQWAYAM